MLKWPPYASIQEFSPLIVQQATYLTEPTCPEPSMVLAPHLCSFSLMSFWNRSKEALTDSSQTRSHSQSGNKANTHPVGSPGTESAVLFCFFTRWPTISRDHCCELVMDTMWCWATLYQEWTSYYVEPWIQSSLTIFFTLRPRQMDQHFVDDIFKQIFLCEWVSD